MARKPLGLVVADASVVVAALAPAQAAGDWAVSVLARPRRVAPRLMPFEVATAFRRMQLSKLIDSAGATAAHNDLLGLGVDLWPHRRLAERELRDTITYGDACYVALAELLGAPLVTLDRRLTRAPGPRCAFLTPPEA